MNKHKYFDRKKTIIHSNIPEGQFFSLGSLYNYILSRQIMSDGKWQPTTIIKPKISCSRKKIRRRK